MACDLNVHSSPGCPVTIKPDDDNGWFTIVVGRPAGQVDDEIALFLDPRQLDALYAQMAALGQRASTDPGAYAARIVNAAIALAEADPLFAAQLYEGLMQANVFGPAGHGRHILTPTTN